MTAPVSRKAQGPEKTGACGGGCSDASAGSASASSASAGRTGGSSGFGSRAADLATQNLAAGVLRNLIDERHAVRSLVSGQAFTAVGDEFVLACLLTVFEADKSSDGFAPVLIGSCLLYTSDAADDIALV